MSIKVFYDIEDFKLKRYRKVVKIIKQVIEKEMKIEGDLNLIFTDDKTIKELNREFLGHNYFTDVIAFNNNTENFISGEIYISIVSVNNNSINYNVSLEEEIIRVLVHGILHLCGYSDDKIENREIMKKLEDSWILEYLKL